MPTVTQGQILRALAKGAVIRVEYINHPPSNVRRIYTLSSPTQAIREQTVNRLLADRLIRANADGLFGSDGPPQSYSLFPASEGGA